MTSTRTTVRARLFSARRWAVVAPTLPAPTTVILLSMPKATSPAPRVHVPPRVRAQRVDLIERAAIGECQALLGTAIRARGPRRRNQGTQVVIGCARAQRLPQVHAALGVQTQEPGAIGREPAAVAAGAKRRRHRRNHAERGAIRQPEPLGGRARGRPVVHGADWAVPRPPPLENLALPHHLLR